MKKSEYGTGTSFLSLLTISFIILKLTGVIDWSWVWVLAPIWIPIVIVVSAVIIGFLALLIAYYRNV